MFKMRIPLLPSMIFTCYLTLVCAHPEVSHHLGYVQLLSDRIVSEGELKWVKEHIEKSDFENPFEIAKTLKKFGDDFKRIGHNRISTMLELFATEDLIGRYPVACSSGAAKQFIDMTTIAFGSFDKYLSIAQSDDRAKPELLQSNKKLFQFLKWNGDQVWKRCLKPAEIQISFMNLIGEINVKAEESLDSLFSSTTIYQDQELVAKVKNTDFVGSQIDGKSMFESMREYLKRENPKSLVNSYKMAEFIENNCKLLYPKLSGFFDGYNLARALFSDEPTLEEENSAKFNKLNQYSRLCGQILRPSTSQIAIKNIAKSTPKIVID